MPVTMKRLNSKDEKFSAELNTLLNRDESVDSGVDAVVAEVIADVAKNGDQALYRSSL